MARTWYWIEVAVALAIHAEQLAEHGGGPSAARLRPPLRTGHGVRDRGLLESAMARPQQLAAYGEPDAADFAAAYAFGIARNHPFVDGNKRAAAVISETFLALNGHTHDASDAELVVAMQALAAGELSEAELADWFRGHLR